MNSNDLLKETLRLIATLACFGSWFALSRMLILNQPTTLNVPLAWGFWGIFGVLSIAGMIGRDND